MEESKRIVKAVTDTSMGTVNIPVTAPGSGQRMNMEQFMCWAMSAICSGGGFYGYMQKTSIPSLVAGVGFGALYGLSGYYIRNGRSLDGIDLSILTSTVLLAVMGPRAYRTKAQLPTTLASAAAILLLRMGYSSYNLRHRPT